MLQDRIIEFIRLTIDNIYVKPKYITDLILHPKKYYDHESYYTDRNRKSNFKIWYDQLKQTIKYSYPNEFYFPYGFDVKENSEIETYLHYEPFSRLRDKRNKEKNSTIAVLRDKFLFGMFTDYLGIKSSKSIGISMPTGILDLQDKQIYTVEDFFNKYPNGCFFTKPIDGECGSGIFKHKTIDGKIYFEDSTDVIEFIATLKKNRYLIQETVVQHNVLRSLHPESINTIRLVTVRNQRTKKVDVFPSILRIGTGSSFVDNTSMGGVAVGIDLNTGKLKEYGFYKPGYGTKVSIHPDSKIRFSDVIIPHFDKCKEQAVYLHEMLPGIQSIGWDIAIGEDEPIFIEGNDNWEINGPQICNGGLKENLISRLK